MGHPRTNKKDQSAENKPNVNPAPSGGEPDPVLELIKENKNPPLLQPTLGPDGWDKKIDAHHARIITALVFVQNLIDQKWPVVNSMMFDQSEALKLQKAWSEFGLGLGVSKEEKARVEPEPLSYQEMSNDDQNFRIGWAYVPIFFIDSELLEAVSFDLHEIEKSSSDRNYDGYYDVKVLSYLPGFDHIKEVRLPKTIKVSDVSLGRP